MSEIMRRNISRISVLVAGTGCLFAGACGPPNIIEADAASTDGSADTESSDDSSEVDSGESSDDTGDESSTTSTDAGEVCGDGVLGDAEECDDGNDDDTDGCLSNCVVARICSQILAQSPAATDGPYTLDPDGDGGEPPFWAYCDMSSDDGGWTLVAKVHRFHAGDAYVEPGGWFAQALDTDALLDPISYEDRPPGVASHGQVRLGAALPDIAVARFRVIAEDDTSEVATWFKAVDDDAFAWFGDQPHAQTPVCEDLELTLGCDQGRIPSTDWTPLEGMNLADYGYPAACVLHMRLEGDSNGDVFSALCSCTEDNDGNAWPDDAIDGHWGNGLEIWFR